MTIASFGGRLARSEKGLAAIEFALMLPFLVILLFYGLELAHFAIARERVSELATMVADNASRMGDQDVLSNKRITEAEINDVFIGSILQSQELDIQNKGRIILSSLETNAGGGQWIHWQRCFGNKSHPPVFGEEGDGETDNTFPGMGKPGKEVKAFPNLAVMFVEVAIDYQPLISAAWAPATEITDYATFMVRDDRDLSQVHNPETVDVSDCEA